MSTTNPPPGDRSSARNRSILKFFATSLASRGVGIGCQLVQLPIALHYLGIEAFGLWSTLSAMGYVLSFSDFGVGMGAQNQLSEAFGTGDDRRARRLFFTALIFLAAVAAALLAVLMPIGAALSWRGVFKLHDPALIAGVRGAMLAFIGLCCVGVPLGLSQRLAYGLQVGWLNNAGQAAANVVIFAAVLAGSHWKLGFGAFVAITWAPYALVNFIQLLYLVTRLGWWRVGADWFDRSTLRGLMNMGALFAVQQIGTVALFSAPPIIISTLLGTAAVTPFNLAQRLFSVFQILQCAMLLPLWPAYAEAKARGDFSWIERTFKRSLGATFLMTILPMAVASIFGRTVIEQWMHIGGKHADPGSLPTLGLIGLLFLWNALVCVQQPFGYLLAGVSVIARNTLYSALTTVSSGALMFALTAPLGVNGVVIGLVAGFVPFCFVGSMAEVWKYLRSCRRQQGASDPAAEPADFPLEEAAACGPS